MCVSIADQPGPVREKPRELAIALALVALASLAVGLAQPYPVAAGLAVFAVSFLTALLTSYGRRLLGVSFSLILAMVLSISLPAADIGAVLRHSVLVLIGGGAYAAYAVLAAVVLDRHQRRLALTEALRAFAGYLHLKAEMLDPAADGDDVQRRLTDALTALTERFQAARDVLFPAAGTTTGRRDAAALVVTLDTFEFVLSSQADDAFLRAQPGAAPALVRFRALSSAMAGEVERLAGALFRPTDRATADPLRPILDAAAAAVASATNDPVLAGLPGADTRAALQGTLDKLGHAADKLSELSRLAADPAMPDTVLADLDLAPFASATDYRLGLLRRQFSLDAPVLRYAVRLSLAMLCAYVLWRVLPFLGHGSWILLTVAVTLRANYSMTRQRRRERVVGTLIGCVLAAVLLELLPPWGLGAVLVVAVGVAHAFVAVRYRITAAAAAIMALLQLHLLDPSGGILLPERLMDTLVGVGIAFAFSPLLQNWERRAIPQLVRALLDAAETFCDRALDANAEDQAYRLARKRALDRHGALALAVRRMLDEPPGKRSDTAELNRLLAANYMLASSLTSVHSLLLMRGGDLDRETAASQLHAARDHAMAVLRGAIVPRSVPHPRISVPAEYAQGVPALLARRLSAVGDRAEALAASASMLLRLSPATAAALARRP
jgi:uncharacterized membrane protein YccC